MGFLRKKYDTTDFFVLRTPEILKTFEIRSFFFEKWLLSHVFSVPKVRNRNTSVPFLTFCPLYHTRNGVSSPFMNFMAPRMEFSAILATASSV